MDETGSLLPTALKMVVNTNPSKPESVVSDIALKTANFYLQNDKCVNALEAAGFISVDERIHFYKCNGFDDEFVDLLQKTKRLPELYRFLKGHSKFEEGKNIAEKLCDINGKITFALMNIRLKLQNINHPVYSQVAQQNDANELCLLSKNTKDDFLQQQLLYYITLLKGRDDWNVIQKELNGYFKIKIFNLHVNMFENNPSKFNVLDFFKNLSLLLDLHESESECMLKFFDVQNNKGKCYICPLMLLELHIFDAKKYKKDLDGMIIMNESELQTVFRKHTKSFAANWLRILDKIVGYKEEKHSIFSSYVKAKDIIKLLYYYRNVIECKYYYKHFEIRCPKTLNIDVCTMLRNLLNVSWICYVPITHESVQSLTKNHAIKSYFRQLKLKNSTDFLSFAKKWVFHGSNEHVFDFTMFAIETISSYFSIKLSEIKMIDLSPVISNLEMITIGLLGIYSERNSEHQIIIPQCYEIVTEFFDEMNSVNLFFHLANSKLNSDDVLDLVHMIIEILVGDMHLKSMLSMTLRMKYPDDYPLQYQFERCFVLALTLLGNLAPYLTDIVCIMQQSFEFLKDPAHKFKTHQKDLMPMVNKAIGASTTKEVFLIINAIQQLHNRNMIAFDFINNSFKTVLPRNFPCSPLHCKADIIVPQSLSSKDYHTVQSTAVFPWPEISSPLHKESTLEEKSIKPTVAVLELSRISKVKLSPLHKESTSEEKPTKPTAVVQEISHISKVKLSSLHEESASVEEPTKPTTVPRELKLLPHFMLTKDEKALFSHIHIDKQVAKNSQ